jgi:hypothetical protein
MALGACRQAATRRYVFDAGNAARAASTTADVPPLLIETAVASRNIRSP